MAALYRRFANLFEMIPYAVLALTARIAGAVPFWRSGQSKARRRRNFWDQIQSVRYRREENIPLSV